MSKVLTDLVEVIIDIDIVLYNKSLRNMEPGEGRWNRGIIYFIILTMAKDGPIYGNQISNLIWERTEGAWRPGAGSIYPALERLKRRGLIERYEEGGKAMYRLTEKGSALVAKIREKHFERSPVYKFMGKLWMDTMGAEGRMRFILTNAQHTSDSIEENLRSIKAGLENQREYEAFLINYELELEKTLMAVREAKKELSRNQEVK